MHSALLQERFLAVLAGHVRTHIIFAGHGSCLVGVRSAANEGPHQHRISTASAPARFPVTVPTPEPEAEAERRPHGSPRARVQAEACAGACGLPAAVERRPEDGIRRCFVLHPSGSEQSSCDGSKHDDDDDDKAHEDPPACSPVVCLLVPPADRTYPHVRSTAPPFPTPYSSSSYGLESFSFLLPPSSFPPSLSLVPPLPSTLPGLGASAGRSDGDGKRAIQAQGSSIRAPGLVPPPHPCKRPSCPVSAWQVLARTYEYEHKYGVRSAARVMPWTRAAWVKPLPLPPLQQRACSSACATTLAR
ncbi:hypothetical protein DCS_07637 [Drechmeria coniospora]|uniref:Uncharacterized protein n=1 Tax=Drechmeria coniospora TaxID=98403 RepID=A0A151GF16_DRECN|nr:hypothetical protein DCS_07637 [Drechmeria coniospora]KYK55673.1 hypothetical protein DCS_07637 [Drechmeria coniospora]